MAATAPAIMVAPNGRSYKIVQSMDSQQGSNMTDTPTIQLIAPSGWPDPDALARGIERLRAAGCEVTGEASGLRRNLRFAGRDSQRAAEINGLADPRRALPDIVMAVRGGYGVHRLLQHLDYAGLRQRLHGAPCVVVGHSDITALSLALLAKADLVTFAGPMLAYDFGGESTSRFTLDAFWNTVRASASTARWQCQTLMPIESGGTLWGGNLATLCSLMGTPYLPDIHDGILFLEDVGEPLYRVERMFHQLHHAGVLARQHAVLLGDFSGYRTDEYDSAYDMEAVVRELRRIANVPVVTGLPFGHCADKLTLPIGAPAHLRVDADGNAELSFSGYPHLDAEARPAMASRDC